MNKKDFAEIVNMFDTVKDSQGNKLNMHSLLISVDNDVLLHRFNNRHEFSDIRSISKTVLTLVTGIARDLSIKGYYPHFDENTYVYPIIKDIIDLSNKSNLPYLKKIKVKHLLTHTIGYDKILLMRDDIAEMDPFTYLNYIVNEPIVHQPGEHYLYSNAGFYLLSVVLQEFLKEDLLQFTNRHLFKKLNIKNYKWEKYGNYLAGATRLWLLPEDLLKIGKILMDYGKYDNERIIEKDWIEKILVSTTRTKDVDTPNAIFRRFAYAHGLWLGKENIFFGHGTDGQTLAIIPKKRSIIVTLAEQKDVVALENIVDYIIKEKIM
ncbi:MAG: serine hydrolase [Tissierellaceae bacterium]